MVHRDEDVGTIPALTRILLATALLFASSTIAGAPIKEIESYDAIQRAIKASPARIRVVNLWATWCGPCVAEMPDLQKIAARFPHVEVIGVSLDDALPGKRAEMKTKVEQFLRDRGVRFRNFYFTGRQVELTDKFNFEGELPVTFVYGSDGKELARVTGQLNYDSFVKKLSALDQRKR